MPENNRLTLKEASQQLKRAVEKRSEAIEALNAELTREYVRILTETRLHITIALQERAADIMKTSVRVDLDYVLWEVLAELIARAPELDEAAYMAIDAGKVKIWEDILAVVADNLDLLERTTQDGDIRYWTKNNSHRSHSSDTGG